MPETETPHKNRRRWTRTTATEMSILSRWRGSKSRARSLLLKIKTLISLHQRSFSSKCPYSSRHLPLVGMLSQQNLLNKFKRSRIFQNRSEILIKMAATPQMVKKKAVVLSVPSKVTSATRLPGSQRYQAMIKL